MEIEDIAIIKKTNNLPWVEKYRPPSINELISHDSIIRVLQKFMNERKLPNLLFYGPPGTGKTSTIIACAKELYKNQFNSMVLELNASDERGINVVREQIKNFASMHTISFSKESKIAKLIILDEADNMTKAAQMALRRIIEKYAKNARFCLICNYQSKIIPALQSRCTKYKFKQIPLKDAIERVKSICLQENLLINEKVFKLCDGDMRKVVNMLQGIQISLQGQNNLHQVVDEKYIHQLTGTVGEEQINQIFHLLNNSTVEQAYQEISKIKLELGLDLLIIVQEISDLLLQQDLPDYMKLFLFKNLSDIEYRLSIDCQEEIQLCSLISAFYQSRNLNI